MVIFIGIVDDRFSILLGLANECLIAELCSAVDGNRFALTMENFIKKIVRILTYVFNFILLIYGLFLLICGLMIINDMRLFSHFLESKMFWPPYFITFNGFMMALLALFGLYATYSKNYKLLVTFAISALVVLLVEVAIITSVSTEKPSYAENIRVSLERSLSNYNYADVDKKEWHYVQRRLECCGIEGPEDWSRFYSRTQVPASCCIIAPDQPDVLCRNSPDSEIIYQYGCHQTLLKRLTDHWSVVSLLAALAALLQVIILVLSILMAFLVKREKRAREKQ